MSPTASIYYTRDHHTPDFVLIDGSHADVDLSTAFALTEQEAATFPRECIDRACRTLGWKLIDEAPVVRQADGRGTVRIEPVQPVTANDWTDHPTLVRMDDSTANLLTTAADRLGIPADVLAAGWIRRAAADALSRHEWYADPAHITDQTRITGWLGDGTPLLKD